jgi:protein-S-isoprenylcysteine O-methyltransferase Ste14
MKASLSSGASWVVLQFAVLGLEIVVPFLMASSMTVGSAMPGFVVVGLAVGLALWAGQTLGASLTPLPRPREDAVLITEGPYRWVRHPIYSALLLASLGWAWVWTSWVLLGLAAALTVVFVFKTRLEERWLTARYPDYAAYRGRTGGLLPSLFRR